MRVVSHRKLKEFYELRGREDSKIAIEKWYDVVEHADWSCFADIKEDFPTADSIGKQRFIFNIRGNNYRLVVVIKFVMGYVFIRWIGTHKEYDKIDCRTI